MIQKYQLYVLAAVLFISVGMNLTYAYQLRQLQIPAEAEQVYGYKKMFLDGALMYKPKGYAGFKIFDLSEATVVITESATCATMTIHTPNGNIEGPCVAGYPTSAFAALQKE